MDWVRIPSYIVTCSDALSARRGGTYQVVTQQSMMRDGGSATALFYA